MMLGTAGHALSSEPREYFIAGDGLNPAAVQIVVTLIKRLPREGEFVKEIGYHVLHELVTPGSRVPRHLLKLRLYFRGKVDFHSFGSFSENTRYAVGMGGRHSLPHFVMRQNLRPAPLCLENHLDRLAHRAIPAVSRRREMRLAFHLRPRIPHRDRETTPAHRHEVR